MNRPESKLVRSGMTNVVKAYHKLGINEVTSIDPSIKEAFDLLDLAIMDLKESLGYERNGDWDEASQEVEAGQQ